ncbi:zinc knuckle (CCHC-type) family protein [Striga asiatica]|uniref:Zinc knuckle (CCHC-type) family protein n=1 Tax=Striga asiatica TaxID=4170 RepID=A0A5A7Q5Y4_STRAF|nr:zinc knuckle (CCHC-type) family protein [Striga asiatica]
MPKQKKKFVFRHLKIEYSCVRDVQDELGLKEGEPRNPATASKVQGDLRDVVACSHEATSILDYNVDLGHFFSLFSLKVGEDFHRVSPSSNSNNTDKEANHSGPSLPTASSNGLKLAYTALKKGVVKLDKDDVDDVKETWGYCLMGYFTHRHPGKEALLKICNSWKVDVLHGGPYTMFGRSLLLKMLPDWFRFGDDDIKITSKAIDKIASGIGKPITTEKLTETKQRCSYEREIDLSKEREYAIQVETPNGSCFAQAVVNEFVPHYCNRCNHIGHPPSKCHILPMKSKKKKSRAQPEKQIAADAKGVTKATKRHHQHIDSEADKLESSDQGNKSTGDNVLLNKAGDQPVEKETIRENAQLSKAEVKRPKGTSEPEKGQGLEIAQALEARVMWPRTRSLLKPRVKGPRQPVILQRNKGWNFPMPMKMRNNPFNCVLEDSKKDSSAFNLKTGVESGNKLQSLRITLVNSKPAWRRFKIYFAAKTKVRVLRVLVI